MNTLEIKNLTKRYGDMVAVDDLSLSVKKGEFFGFLGKNGAGKSTTIHAISGIARFHEGTIKVSGVDVVEDYRLAWICSCLCDRSCISWAGTMAFRARSDSFVSMS